jgi:hypothetical protein
MRRRFVLGLIGLAALASAGLAVGKSLDQSRSVSAVSGTFTATTLNGKSLTSSCTTSDGKTITVTRATFTGTSTGAPDLTGPVSIATNSLINTTDGVGEVDARLQISAAGGKTDLRLIAVYDHGNIAGLASGHGATPSVRLVGNLSGSFSTSAGITAGKIGGGTFGGSAVALGPGRCQPAAPAPHENSEATGTITALTSTSITVAGLTCTIPTTLATLTANFKLGQRAHIKCTLANGTSTLTKINSEH